MATKLPDRRPRSSWSRTRRRSARGLCDVLAFHGYEPSGVERRRERAARGPATARTTLVVLDVMLPRRSGFDVCRGAARRAPAAADPACSPRAARRRTCCAASAPAPTTT